MIFDQNLLDSEISVSQESCDPNKNSFTVLKPLDENISVPDDENSLQNRHVTKELFVNDSMLKSSGEDVTRCDANNLMDYERNVDSIENGIADSNKCKDIHTNRMNHTLPSQTLPDPLLKSSGEDVTRSDANSLMDYKRNFDSVDNGIADNSKCKGIPTNRIKHTLRSQTLPDPLLKSSGEDVTRSNANNLMDYKRNVDSVDNGIADNSKCQGIPTNRIKHTLCSQTLPELNRGSKTESDIRRMKIAKLEKNIEDIRISKLKSYIQNTRDILKKNVKTIDDTFKSKSFTDYDNSNGLFDRKTTYEDVDCGHSTKLDPPLKKNKKIAENLSLITNNIHEMLTESFRGIDLICHKVREYVGDFQINNSKAIIDYLDENGKVLIDTEETDEPPKKFTGNFIKPPSPIKEEREDEYEENYVNNEGIDLRYIKPPVEGPALKHYNLYCAQLDRKMAANAQNTSQGKQATLKENTAVSLPDWFNDKKQNPLDVPKKRIDQRKLLEKFRDFLKEDVDICLESLPTLINNLNKKIDVLSNESLKHFRTRVQSNQIVSRNTISSSKMNQTEGKKESHMKRLSSQLLTKRLKEVQNAIKTSSLSLAAQSQVVPKKPQPRRDVPLNGKSNKIVRFKKKDPPSVSPNNKTHCKDKTIRIPKRKEEMRDRTSFSPFYAKESRMMDLQKTYGKPLQNEIKKKKMRTWNFSKKKPVRDLTRNGTPVKTILAKESSKKIVIGRNVTVTKKEPNSNKISTIKITQKTYYNKEGSSSKDLSKMNKRSQTQTTANKQRQKSMEDNLRRRLTKSKSSEYFTRTLSSKRNQRKRFAETKFRPADGYQISKITFPSRSHPGAPRRPASTNIITNERSLSTNKVDTLANVSQTSLTRLLHKPKSKTPSDERLSASSDALLKTAVSKCVNTDIPKLDLREIYQPNTYIFLVSELFNNRQLFGLIKTLLDSCKDSSNYFTAMKQILDGVEHLRISGFPATDLSPENILMNSPLPDFDTFQNDWMEFYGVLKNEFKHDLKEEESLKDIRATPGAVLPIIIKTNLVGVCSDIKLLDVWTYCMMVNTLLWRRKQMVFLRCCLKRKFGVKLSEWEWTTNLDASQELLKKFMCKNSHKSMSIRQMLIHPILKAVVQHIFKLQKDDSK